MLIVIHSSYPGNNKSIPYVFFYLHGHWREGMDEWSNGRLPPGVSIYACAAMASQITSLTIVNWTVCPRAGERKPQSSASLAFVKEIHRWPVNSPHKELVRRKMFQFDDVIMCTDVTLWSSRKIGAPICVDISLQTYGSYHIWFSRTYSKTKKETSILSLL